MNGYTRIHIGGKERGLKFGTRAIFELVDMLGLRLESLEFKQDFKTICSIVYVGLVSNCKIKKEEPDFDFEDVENWVDDMNLDQMGGIFVEFSKSLGVQPEQAATETEEDKKKEAELQPQ